MRDALCGFFAAGFPFSAHFWGNPCVVAESAPSCCRLVATNVDRRLKRGASGACQNGAKSCWVAACLVCGSSVSGLRARFCGGVLHVLGIRSVRILAEESRLAGAF